MAETLDVIRNQNCFNGILYVTYYVPITPLVYTFDDDILRGELTDSLVFTSDVGTRNRY
jgi:hypothetical protein